MNDSFLMPGKIIKAGNQRNASIVFGSLIKNQIINAEERAAQILKEAYENASDLISIAETESENIRREAYQTGRDEAESELIDNLLAIKEIRLQALQEVEQDVLKLSIKLAEKIIGREVQQDETVRGEIVLNALRQARQQEMLTVRVNANDLPLVEQMRERLDSFGRAKYVDFIADQSVKEGGCIIESQSGTIDARLETQLRILENSLLARVEGEK
jgi:type III secretion protein L